MKKYNIWCCVLIISLICFYILYFICMNRRSNIEPFITENGLSYSLYAKFYEKVFSQKEAFQENINKISSYIDSKADLNILDIGSGAGRHYELLKAKYKNVTGLDKSPEFIERAKIRNPNGKFMIGNAIESSLYPENSFNHITCFFETIHHNTSSDKKRIFKNIHKWLKPGGKLFINFFIKDKLDPAPREFSQYFYDEHKIKHSLTYFENITHDAWWNDSSYHEQYINKDGKSFIKVHKFHIEKLEDLYLELKNAGLQTIEILDYKGFDINDMVLCVAKKE